ncbi:MAG: hypothetical protein FWD89_04785, partial [Firmicutes bacterium]|nr:hypothetical protein [Bacillota bacterium]
PFILVACGGGGNGTQYTITAPTGEGFVFERVGGTGDKVNKGGEFKFTVVLVDDCIILGCICTPIVKVNNTILTVDNDGVFVITNIQENKTITVEQYQRHPDSVENICAKLENMIRHDFAGEGFDFFPILYNYGKFNGFIVFRTIGVGGLDSWFEIGGSWFNSFEAQRIIAWRDSEVFLIVEAFENGILTEVDLKEIAYITYKNGRPLLWE